MIGLLLFFLGSDDVIGSGSGKLQHAHLLYALSHFARHILYISAHNHKDTDTHTVQCKDVHVLKY